MSKSVSPQTFSMMLLPFKETQTTGRALGDKPNGIHDLLTIVYQYYKKQKQTNCDSRIVIFDVTGICPC